MTERFCMRTFVAKAEGRRVIVRVPGPEEWVADMRSEQSAGEAARHIRQHGVDCCHEALDRLLRNF